MFAPTPNLGQCKGCDHLRPRDIRSGCIRTNLNVISANAKQGCATCSVLLRGVRNCLDSLESVIDNVGELRVDFNTAGVKRSLEVSLLGTPIRLSFFRSEDTPWISEMMPDVPLGTDVPESTSSGESLAWAVERIRSCKASHKFCNFATESSLPRRVLDVMANAKGGVSLYESVGESAPYVCLSHCWGRKPFLRTLSSNLASHTKGIVWDLLQPTFQDAVECTRKLGIKYLWIDSLCIVQDDQDDWRREAANMASIYRNCFLVISAAKSQSAYEGLYAAFPVRCKTRHLAVATGDGRTETVSIRQSLTHGHRLFTPYIAQPTMLPIFTRGWIFQERFLSPRVLHFGPEELSWECFESSNCQCTSNEADAVPLAWGSPNPIKDLMERSARPKTYYNAARWQTMSTEELLGVWHRLVEDYSTLQLTFEKDIFPAISGLAKELQAITKSTYLAGLWQHSLLRDVLWHVDSSRGDDSWMERPTAWRAPSWSWAAVKSPVAFLDTAALNPLCEVVATECEPAGPDPMGELSGGCSMTLRGQVIPTTARLKRQDPLADQLQSWNMMDLDMLKGHMKNLWIDHDCHDIFPSGNFSGQIEVGVEVSCVLIGRRQTGVPVFILLSRDDAGSVSSEHQYRRIGLLEVLGGPAGPVPWAWLAKLLALGYERTVTIV